MTTPSGCRNKSKAIGTRAESAVVRYLRGNGFPYAERRALTGAHDQGDITGTPGVCWEVKGGRQAWEASDKDITDWLTETQRETVNAGASLGILVVQRRGVGTANAGRWWGITRANAWLPSTWKYDFPVRVLLADMCYIARAAGYGQPLLSPEEAGAR